MTEVRRTSEHEGGSIMIMAAAAAVVMILAAALAVDIGRQALDKRSDRKVADLASIDAVRALDDVNPCNSTALQAHLVDVATQSANRNGYKLPDSANGHSLSVVAGKYDSAGNFASVADACTANAVMVTAGSTTVYQFQKGSKDLTAGAISALGNTPTPGKQTTTPSAGGFRLGSFLASLSASSAGVLNPFVEKMLGGPGGTVNLTALSWQGIGNSTVTLQELQNELLALGADVGTPDKLMNTQVTVAKLLQATANALTKDGKTAEATSVGSFLGLARTSTLVSIGAISKYQTGGSALNIPVSVGDIVVGSAEIANGTNAVNIPSATVSVPGVTNLAMSLQVVHTPVDVAYGSFPQTLSTSQLTLSMTPTISTPATISGLSGVIVSGTLPTSVQGAGADATMTTGRCASNPGLDFSVTPKPYDLASATPTGQPLSVKAANVLVATVAASAAQTITNTPLPATLDFPTYFPPAPNTLSAPKHVGSTSIGLDTLSYSTTVNTIGLGVNASAVATGTVSALQAIMAQLDSTVKPVLAALGLEVGGADLWGLQVTCSGKIVTNGSTISLPPILVK
jgi:uncharacterized membrane protein